MPQSRKKKRGAVTAGERQRNKVRGVMGAARQGSGLKNKPKQAVVIREGIRKVLLEARRDLPAEDRRAFFDWLSAVGRGAGGSMQKAAAFELMRPVLVAPRISLEDEIAWLMRRLSPHLADLCRFRRAATELNAAFWRGDPADAKARIASIEEEFGRSIWSIEARLALEQYYSGLEGQKKYLSEIKKAYPSGLPAYIAHFLSIRNEETSTLRLFRDDVLRRIEDTKLFSQAKTYLRYKIADVFSGTDQDISAIIRTEQGQSVLDVYETAVDIFQRLIKLRRIGPYKEIVLEATEQWAAIGDERLTKIRAALGARTAATFDPDSGAAIDAMLEGRPHDARRRAARALRADPSNVWAGIEAAVSDSLLGRSLSGPAVGPWPRIHDLLVEVLSRNGEFEAASGALEQFARNFRPLQTSAALWDFASALSNSRTNPQMSIANASLNAFGWAPADLLIATGNAKSDVAASCHLRLPGGVIDFWTGAASTAEATPAIVAARGYIQASILAEAGRSEEALRTATQMGSRRLPAALRGLISNQRIELAIEAGEPDAALVYVAEEAAMSPSVRPILPIEAVVLDRPWSDLGRHPNKLELAIALDVLWRRTDDDLRATHLRFAFEDYLGTTGASKPSEIEPTDGVPIEQLIYFLRYICLPSVMDLAGIFETSRDLTDERVAVCTRLVQLDPVRADDYEHEIREIGRRILIQDGLKIVDSNRIHVDTAALSRSAEHRYGESFSRYKALVEAGIGVAEDFDALLRRAVKASDGHGETFIVPDNEADALLLDIMLTLKNEFLNSPEHGLHFYLGKRVRHGTITGHLRGPLENVNLITTKTTGGSYTPNLHWIPRLLFVTPAGSTECQQAFDTFAGKYDEIVRILKEDILHVNSKEHPRGLFEITITPLSYHIVRSAIRQDLTFEGFLSSCYAVFWALLEQPLSQAREIIGHDSKSEAALLFDELQEAVRHFATPNAAYHELGTAIRNASVEVQTQFDLMADWLRRAEVAQASHIFELSELIDIAVQSALTTHKSFNPVVEKVVSGDVGSPASVLVILTDIVFIVIDNVCRRSMSGQEPLINLSCRFDADAETLTLEITNPVGASINRAAVEERLGEIRGKIVSGDIRAGAGGDRGSGLLKIASITQQSSRGHLEFGFVGETQFKTTITLSVIMHGESVALATEGAVE